MNIKKINFKGSFKLESDYNNDTISFAKKLGWILLIFIWWIVPTLGLISPVILPPPSKILIAFWQLLMGRNYEWAGIQDFFSQLIQGDHLLSHILYSSFINVLGYLEAVLIAIPLGFLMALFPLPKYMFSSQLDSFRYLALPAATGIFIALFGIGTGVKVHFLAVGILVYLLPVVVQRVSETEKQYIQTMKTLGATNWQKLRFLYIPLVLSRVAADVIILVAISWTYITIAEALVNTGGLGGIAVNAGHQNHNDYIIAILILVIILGTTQDKLFRNWKKRAFKFSN
jgi:NitT/TauT family transport system permease protein